MCVHNENNERQHQPLMIYKMKCIARKKTKNSSRSNNNMHNNNNDNKNCHIRFGQIERRQIRNEIAACRVRKWQSNITTQWAGICVERRKSMHQRQQRCAKMKTIHSRIMYLLARSLALVVSKSYSVPETCEYEI